MEARTRGTTSPGGQSGGESRGSIFRRFLRFGSIAWGGPAAQIEMIKRECVDEERWVGDESFRKTLAVYQVIPGPEALELCVYFGRTQAGRIAGLLAGLGFMLPGFLLMLGLSVAYVELELADNLDQLFYGLKAAVGAIVARAIVRLGRSFVTGPVLALIALAAFVLSLTGALPFVLVLALAGLSHELWVNGRRWRRRASTLDLPVWLGAAAVLGATLPLTAELFLEGLRAGGLSFGGAFAAIPFIQDAAVGNHGWITEEQFLDGLAIGSVLPAPLVIFATFVGYLAGGLGGSLLMTLGILLPAFVLPTLLHRHLVAVAESPRFRPLLLGVATGAIGLIAAVTVDIVRAGIVDVWTALLALGAFAVLQTRHGKLTILYVVAGCGLAGVLLQATVA